MVQGMAEEILIDGSAGEGGGQILRTALTLSLLTGTPFCMTNIRARRPNPGLRNQHLQCLRAAAAISRGKMDGATLGSPVVRFKPGKVRQGIYKFEIGTAGSVGLLLHTLYLPLALQAGGSELVLRGGTHVPWSPSYAFLEDGWLYFLKRLGFRIFLQLKRPGFFPRGGGEVWVGIRPAGELMPLHLSHRGEVLRIAARSVHWGMGTDFGERQAKTARAFLAEEEYGLKFEDEERESASPGGAFSLVGFFENGRCCYTALSQRGKSPESVASEACMRFLAFLQTGKSVDEYTADQILLPLALAEGESEFTTVKVSRHLLTNRDTICRFLPVGIAIEGELGEEGRVRIRGRRRGRPPRFSLA
jgi:RNA 3'-terminal phosphate cyclase (ATP)